MRVLGSFFVNFDTTSDFIFPLFQFFRINDPYRIVFVFLFLVLVRTIWLLFGLSLSVPELHWMLVGERLSEGFIQYKGLFDDTGPLSAMVYKYLDFLFGRSRWVHYTSSTLLIIFQAGTLNQILLKNKAYEENTYIPAFLYVVVIMAIPDFFALSPQLMALTFILLALNNIFRRIDNVITDELFLSSGIYLGFATFFYLPSVVFLVTYLFSFILFSSAALRRLLLFLFGTFVVFAAVWSYFYLNNASDDFMDTFFGTAFRSNGHLIGTMDLLLASLPLALILILALPKLFATRFSNFQQNMQRVMFMFLLSAAVIALLSKETMPPDLLFLVPSVTFFVTYHILLIKKPLWKLILPNLILIVLLGHPVLWMELARTTDLVVKEPTIKVEGKRIMGVGLPISEYRKNDLAGPFLRLNSHERLDALNDYKGASGLFPQLDNSDAEIIIDKTGKIDAVFYRFPTFASKYRKTAKGVYVVIDN